MEEKRIRIKIENGIQVVLERTSEQEGASKIGGIREYKQRIKDKAAEGQYNDAQEEPSKTEEWTLHCSLTRQASKDCFWVVQALSSIKDWERQNPLAFAALHSQVSPTLQEEMIEFTSQVAEYIWMNEFSTHWWALQDAEGMHSAEEAHSPPNIADWKGTQRPFKEQAPEEHCSLIVQGDEAG